MEAEKAASNRLSWKKRLLFKFLLVLIGCSAGWLVGEVFLRVIGYSYPMFYAVDEARGYALSPNMRGWYRKEGETYITINSDGERDEEHQIAKPDNTVRIAVLGDSYAEALQVSLDETFWKIMQGKLNDCGAFDGKKIEVLNFGVSGYGTAQELITLREKAWKYSPDIVILAVTINNDITDNSRHFKRTEIPYFVFQNGELVLDDSFRNSNSFKFNNSYLSRLGGWIRDNSRVIQALQEAQVALKYKYDQWRKKPQAAAQTPPPTAALTAPVAAALAAAPDIKQVIDVGIDHEIYRVPTDEFWNEAWRVTEGIILKMDEEARGKGAKFLVVTLSNGPQVHPQPEMRATYLKYVGADELFYPDKRIMSFAEKHGIASLDLAPELQAYAEKNQVFLHGFGDNIGNGHWNQSGHKIAGEILGKNVCSGIIK